MLLAGRLARISLDLISFWPGRRRLREAAVAPRVERNPRRALHNTYFMRDTARESTGDKNKKRRRASVHSIPFPKIECTRCYFALWKSRNLEILSTKLHRLSIQKRNGIDANRDWILTRERKGKACHFFRFVTFRDRCATRAKKASDFSTSREPEATRERWKPRGKGTTTRSFLFSSRNTRGGAKTASFIREKGGGGGRKEDLSPFDF